MNTVWNSYGQLCGCPEILKKSCNFFVVGLTYGWRRPWIRIFFNPSLPEYFFMGYKKFFKISNRRVCPLQSYNFSM